MLPVGACCVGLGVVLEERGVQLAMALPDDPVSRLWQIENRCVREGPGESVARLRADQEVLSRTDDQYWKRLQL